MKKLFFILGTCISLLIVGCGNNSTNLVKKENINFEEKISKNYEKEFDKKQKDDIEIDTSNNVKENITKESIKIDNKFNFIGSLVDNLYEENQKNIVFSPLSLDMALGMIQVGAVGDTLNDLSKFLNNSNYSEYASNYINNYTFENKGEWYNSIYKVCNSVWANENIEVKDNFKKSLNENFKSDIKKVNFSDNKTVDIMNDWVKEETNGLIDKFISELDPETIMTLVNTVYFEDEWKEQGFITKNTFTDLENKISEVDFVRSTKCNLYFENEYAYGFSKDYKSGLTFIGILPKEEGDFSVKELDLNSLLESATREYDVIMELPKLNFKSDLDLNSILCSNGLSSIYDINSANFSNISETPMVVSDVFQSCNIMIDEMGTKAAAATALMMNKAAFVMDQKEKKEIILDRPFAFMIYDSDNEQIIFIGKVINLSE